jgi:hypothetical protein
MGRNLIVSEDTIRDLLEAHASLAAWYYELSAGLRAAGGSARTPDDATRMAFIQRLADDFPEISAVARTIRNPRMFIPPPPALPSAKAGPGGPEDMPTAIEPAPARMREGSNRPGPIEPAPADPAPPPHVNPSNVKYDRGE